MWKDKCQGEKHVNDEFYDYEILKKTALIFLQTKKKTPSVLVREIRNLRLKYKNITSRMSNIT